MSGPGSQRGFYRPVWVAIGVVTCVAFGATMNQCLVCGPAPSARPVARVSAAAMGAPIDAPPETKLAMLVPPPAPEPRAKPQAGGDPFVPITFDRLASYAYEVPDVGAPERDTEQVPAAIRALAGTRVAIRGFMIPVAVEGEHVTELILVRNQFACCFGVVPRMNEWVHVTMAEGRRAPYAIDIPITVAGTLDVGEVWEQGVVLSLYRIEAVEVTEPPMFR